ncbi:MAG TPA: PilW family protein [Burkholderiales bacterium]|nr:PilW family protein [Burkholderiales bacterium]
MQTLHPTRLRGFSLVELMVAMLIGLIGMIIIFQVFEVSEGIKRTTTSGGDAQQNGAIGLYLMGHDLRNAGMGFNDVGLAGCRILAYDSSRATPNFTLMLVPTLICAPGSTAPGGSCPGTGTAGTSPDQLTVFYGSQPRISNSNLLGGSYTSGDPTVQLNNTYAYSPGDLMVMMQPPVGTSNCSLMEATKVASLTVDIRPAGTLYLLNSNVQVLSRMNRGGGLGVAYGGAGSNVARVFNIGNLYDPANGSAMPVYNTYAIDANKALTVSSAFVIDNVTRVPQVNAVADNIVHMRAQYGLDDGIKNGTVPFNTGAGVAGDGLVDRFLSADVFNALPTPPWQSLIAVRIAIVARSALAEKPHGGNGTDCDATTDGTEGPSVPDQRPVWAGGLIDVSATGDPNPSSPLFWKCYRYQVFETTVPLRNWIWKSS